MGVLQRFLFLVVVLLSSQSLLARDCGGFAAVMGVTSELESACLGLVLSESQVPWKMPRQVLYEAGGSLLISDMGSWSVANGGQVFRVHLKDLTYQVVYRGGRLTHGLGKDTSGRLLIGDANKILRENNQGNFEKVVEGLPVEGSHPLTHFLLLPNDDLVVNVGAPSDNCRQEMGGGTYCPSRDQEGEVRLYSYLPESDSYDSLYRVLGRGLRNSMALLYNPVLDVIYQAENNMDALGTPEEFNILNLESDDVADYGWPFCMGFGMQSAHVHGAFSSFCRNRSQAPAFLIPSHSSPLDMDYYQGEAFPELKNTLVMGWHGHRREVEDALVAYALEENLSPSVVSPMSNPHLQILSGINSQTGEKIRPVGVAIDEAGWIWFVDDKTRKLYVIASGSEPLPSEPSEPQEPSPDEQLASLSAEALQGFALIYRDFMAVQTCTQCHGQDEFPQDSRQALQSFSRKGWIQFGAQARDMVFIQRIAPESNPRSMPPLPDLPFGQQHPQIFQDLESWLLSNLSQQ